MTKSNTQRRYLPSHAVLRSFESAARHESFTLAAEELHLTQSAISRQVKEFEQVIGTALFRRVGRRVVLSDAGKNLAGELAIDLENIRQTVMRAISAGDLGASIRIATLPTFASRWLVPRLPDFFSLYSNIEISLSTRIEPFDMEREKFDIAIHFGKDDWPATNMSKLCSETMIAVASPNFIKQYKLDDISDLINAPLLHIETRPMIWESFFSQIGMINETASTGKYFDQFSMVIAGAVASLGAALVPAYLIEKEIAAGSLVSLCETTISTKNNYYLVTPENSTNQHVDIFINWMKSQLDHKIL